MLNGAFFILASSRSVWWYWEQCDPAAKVVVAILICCSVISISIIVKKIMELRELRRNNFTFENQLLSQEKLTEIGALPNTGNAVPYAQVLSSALNALRKHRGKIFGDDDVRVCMGHIENAIQRMIGRVTARYEKGMIPLSTFVSGGPFLGLLGTVWGVMVTFGALTEKASIAELAPGVSGALVATTFGLLLAIPASFAYNGLLGMTRRMATELDNFASAVADQMENELLEELREHRKTEEKRVPAAEDEVRVPAAGENPFLRREIAGEDAGTLSADSLPRSRPSWE